MADGGRRQSTVGRNRAESNFHTKPTSKRPPSIARLLPFSAEREAIEFFYRRERSNGSLPKRILEQVFGPDFVARLNARVPPLKKRTCTPNQFEDLARKIRVYQRYILSAEIFYNYALSLLPAKAFSAEPKAQKPRMSIFGVPRTSNALRVPSGRMDQKFLGGLAGGFGHLIKGGKKVLPTNQVHFDDHSLLKQTLNITREDYNPNAPCNVIKFTLKAGIVTEDIGISQSEIVFYQKGHKLRTNSAKGKRILDDRALRFPIGPDGNQLVGPRKRYNFIESIFRPQQIWQRQCYEIASQTDAMPISNFQVKIRAYAIDDLYAADIARKNSDTVQESHKQDMAQRSSTVEVLNLTDAEKLAKIRAEYEAQMKLTLIHIRKDTEQKKRKVAEGAEWPVHTAPTKLISLEKQRNIQHLFRGLKLMEKLIIQPFHRPVSADYRYFEDLLDTDRMTGSLFPLWNFRHPRLKDTHVEYAMWHPRYPDLFVCAGGRDESIDSNIGPGQTAGFICWCSLRNPTYPEYLQYVIKPIVSFDIHPKGYVMAAGTNDGNIMYLNLGIRSDGPVAETSSSDEVHTKAVCQVKFLSENSEGDMRFFSVGLEGNFREWTIEKHTLIPTRLMLSTRMPGFFKNPNWHMDQPHCTEFSTFQPSHFLVGTLFGYIHFCDYNHFEHVKHSWRAHELSVSAVRWNSFHKDVFMTCGYDYKIFIFDLQNLKLGPVFQFNFDVGVRDVAWAPFNSTIFAAILTNGHFLLFDLAYSKYIPLCSQVVTVTHKSRPEKLRFNNWGPYVLVSDQAGWVQVFKLSPNLRKIEVVETPLGAAAPKAKAAPAYKKKGPLKGGHSRYPGIDLKVQVSKLDRMLAMFRDTEPPTLRLDAPIKKYVTISGDPLSTKLRDGTELILTGGNKEKPEEKSVPKE